MPTDSIINTRPRILNILYYRDCVVIFYELLIPYPCLSYSLTHGRQFTTTALLRIPCNE